MIICTSQDHFEYLQRYASDGFHFLHQYEWILDAYVSDFFFHNYWSRLPELWRHVLGKVSTGDMAFFLNERQHYTRDVLPLSLLSFKACVNSYSAERQQTKNLEELYNQLQPELQPEKTSGTTDGPCSTCRSDTSRQKWTLPPIGLDGNLHSFYRKHVKPKKQHEIIHLGQGKRQSDFGVEWTWQQTIKLLSDQIGCNHVVDVGSGLGHLARLLSFGHGLKVTSIEAADTHAPKANKYDSELEREIKKKKNKAMVAKEMVETSTNQRPVHVTSMIHADTSMADFLAIIKQSITMETVGGNHGYTYEESETGFAKSANDSKMPVSSTVTADSDENEQILAPSLETVMEMSANSHMDSLGINSTFKQFPPEKLIHENQKIVKHEHLHSIFCKIPEKLAKITHDSKQQLDKLCELSKSDCNSNRSSSTEDMCQTAETVLKEPNVQENIHNVPNVDGCTRYSSISFTTCNISMNCDNHDINQSDISNNCAVDIAESRTTCYTDNDNDQTGRLETDLKSRLVSLTQYNIPLSPNTQSKPTDDNTHIAELHKDASGSNSSAENMGEDQNFILTGLHACGDLTSTFLRFFINCPSARGLASVGCCYMKLTDEGCCPDGVLLGYPMSESIMALPHHHRLSYQARELACHFADTYAQRLADGSPHLRIHGYRATLEWLANQLEPCFQRSSVQIPAKKTNKMDFDSYARQGLQKFGISPDRLTPDLHTTADSMVGRWRDVVAFYTLRLSLAPVVETMILIDRMLYLYEHARLHEVQKSLCHTPGGVSIVHKLNVGET